MTGEKPDLDLLADLDAGLLDPVRAQEVRSAASADPRAAAMLAALAATRTELAGASTPPVPPGLATRWAGSIEPTAPEPPRQPEAATGTRAPGDGAAVPEPPAAGEPHPTAATTSNGGRPRGRSGPGRRTRGDASRPVDGGPPSTRPSGRPRRPRPALLVAVLLAVVVAVGILRPRAEPPPAVDTVGLAAVARGALGVTDVGDLADPTRRSGCLHAVAAPGVEPDAPFLGGRHVRFDGRPGVLLVLGGGALGTFRIVVVDPACGPGHGILLSSTVVGP